MLTTRAQKSKGVQLTLAESTAAQSIQREKEAAVTSSRKRKTQDSEDMLAEYLCPITQELPVDPVVAEDGQCYEERPRRWRPSSSAHRSCELASAG